MDELISRKLDTALEAARNLVESLQWQRDRIHIDGYEMNKDSIRAATEKAAHASQRLTDYAW